MFLLGVFFLCVCISFGCLLWVCGFMRWFVRSFVRSFVCELHTMSMHRYNVGSSVFTALTRVQCALHIVQSVLHNTASSLYCMVTHAIGIQHRTKGDSSLDWVVISVNQVTHSGAVG